MDESIRFYNEAIEEVAYRGMVSTGFQVESVEVWSEKLKGLGYKVSDILNPMPTVKFIFVEDPSGYKIQLVEFVV